MQAVSKLVFETQLCDYLVQTDLYTVLATRAGLGFGERYLLLRNRF